MLLHVPECLHLPSIVECFQDGAKQETTATLQSPLETQVHLYQSPTECHEEQPITR